MAALARMKPRDHGTIVQVGSALGERSIPLQSAYCGAKHAINGFTESVRCELLHEASKVNITIAQMPAVNTPQFSWVLSRLPRRPQPVPPIYQPQLVARAVLSCRGPSSPQAVLGGRQHRSHLVRHKNSPRPCSTDTWPAPATTRSRPASLPTGRRRTTCGQPVDQGPGSDHGARGGFDDSSHDHSPQIWGTRHAKLVAGVATALATGVGVLAARRAR